MKFKKTLSFLLVTIMLFSIASISAFAQECASSIPEDKVLVLPYCPEGETMKIPVGTAEYIDNGSGDLIKISDLLSFETQSDANNYIDEMRAGLKTSTLCNSAVGFNSISREASGDALVDSHNVSLNGSINLRVSYTTSGNHTGRITHHEAYTTFTGFTLGFGWDESMCYSQITASQKDIRAVASGTLTYNLLVDGFIELGREQVDLEGICIAIR